MVSSRASRMPTSPPLGPHGHRGRPDTCHSCPHLPPDVPRQSHGTQLVITPGGSTVQHSRGHLRSRSGQPCTTRTMVCCHGHTPSTSHNFVVFLDILKVDNIIMLKFYSRTMFDKNAPLNTLLFVMNSFY